MVGGILFYRLARFYHMFAGNAYAPSYLCGRPSVDFFSVQTHKGAFISRVIVMVYYMLSRLHVNYGTVCSGWSVSITNEIWSRISPLVCDLEIQLKYQLHCIEALCKLCRRTMLGYYVAEMECTDIQLCEKLSKANGGFRDLSQWLSLKTRRLDSHRRIQLRMLIRLLNYQSPFTKAERHDGSRSGINNLYLSGMNWSAFRSLNNRFVSDPDRTFCCGI